MTIRRRLILSFVAMLVVPLVLIVMVSGILRFLLEIPGDRAGAPPRLAAAPWREPGQLDADQLQAVSRTIADSPRFFEDETALAALAAAIEWPGSLAVTRDGRIVALSPGIDPARAAALVAAGPASKDGRRLRRMADSLAYSWDFAVPGEGDASLRFILDHHIVMRRWMLPGTVFVLLAMLILILTNGALTFRLARTITRPLGRLEAMARRIRDGDLTPLPLPPRRLRPLGARKDEFGRAFAAFDEMRVRLKSSLESQLAQEANRRELIAAISHDLRTPLAAIKGYAEGLRDGVAATPDKRAAYLDTLLRKAGVMDKLIEDLFLFSRLELADFPYERKRVDLAAMLADCVDELASDYPSLAIVYARPEGSFPVDVDPLRLRRVFANLVQNAAAYVDRPDARLDVRLRREGGSAVAEFVDNGPGLAPEQRERIFERFVRGDPARGREGAGLGLSIAKLIVEAQGGRIGAAAPEAAAGASGARFVVELPLAEEKA